MNIAHLNKLMTSPDSMRSLKKLRST